LARHLGQQQPFFGLQPPGLDGHGQPLDRVEDLARCFAGQIRAFHPDGACIIAGYCAGGTIAFELARQLASSGTSVHLLALFGSPFSTWYHRLPQLRYRVGQQVERIVRHTRALACLSTAECRAYIAERLRERNAQRAADRPKAADPVLAQRAKVERATFAALRRYRPTHFIGRLGLFLPSRHWPLASDAAARWRSVAPRTEEYHGPEGCDGSVMLREPYAPLFAGLLEQCLRRSENRADSAAAGHPLAARALNDQRL
ncbi:MAG: thioesterase, partial [Verrucomicrobia bacterium]|nr:thioesterase [Verrucomicrobiota bacterium]